MSHDSRPFPPPAALCLVPRRFERRQTVCSACLVTAFTATAVDPRRTEFAARRGSLLVDPAAYRLADGARECGTARCALTGPAHRHKVRGNLDRVFRRRDAAEELLRLAPMEGDTVTGTTCATGETRGAHIRSATLGGQWRKSMSAHRKFRDWSKRVWTPGSLIRKTGGPRFRRRLPLHQNFASRTPNCIVTEY
jgi:hypothetical protein